MVGWLANYFVSERTPEATRNAYFYAIGISAMFLTFGLNHAWAFLWAYEHGEFCLIGSLNLYVWYCTNHSYMSWGKMLCNICIVCVSVVYLHIRMYVCHSVCSLHFIYTFMVSRVSTVYVCTFLVRYVKQDSNYWCHLQEGIGTESDHHWPSVYWEDC